MMIRLRQYRLLYSYIIVCLLALPGFSATVSGQLNIPAALLDDLKEEEKFFLVYLLPAGEDTAAKLEGREKKVEWLNQRNKTFVPRVVAIETGATMRFGNADPFFHNVYSRDPQLNLGRYPKGFFKEYQFEEPGLVHLFCDIHLNMHAMIYVVETPLYASTTLEKEMRFEIADVPAGSYRLSVWNEKNGLYQTDFTVGEDDMTGVTVDVKDNLNK